MRRPAIEEEHSRGRVLETLEYLGLQLGTSVFGRLPYRAALEIGAAFGAAYGAAVRSVGAREHVVATRNLEIAFPTATPAERDAIRRAMWRSWGRTMVDFARLPRLGRDELRALVRLDPPEGPVEIFRRAREHGSMVLTAHFGSFELLHAGCAAHGFPIALVHRRLPNLRVDRWLGSLRERQGTRVLRRGEAARDVMRELRDGRVVALPFDQRPVGGSAIFVPFFSLPAATNSGVARLALASGAAVFPAVLLREVGTQYHRTSFGAEIPLARTGDRAADVLENTRRFNRAIEDLVRAHPDHWIWMYPRWKRQPGMLGSLYRRGAPPIEVFRRAARAAADQAKAEDAPAVEPMAFSGEAPVAAGPPARAARG